jgi:hypothetical protein
MQHLYGVQSSANTHSTSTTNIPAANTSSAELFSVATYDMSLSDELQNAISAVSVVQIVFFWSNLHRITQNHIKCNQNLYNTGALLLLDLGRLRLLPPSLVVNNQLRWMMRFVAVGLLRFLPQDF